MQSYQTTYSKSAMVYLVALLVNNWGGGVEVSLEQSRNLIPFVL